MWRWLGAGARAARLDALGRIGQGLGCHVKAGPPWLDITPHTCFTVGLDDLLHRTLAGSLRQWQCRRPCCRGTGVRRHNRMLVTMLAAKAAAARPPDGPMGLLGKLHVNLMCSPQMCS